MTGHNPFDQEFEGAKSGQYQEPEDKSKTTDWSSTISRGGTQSKELAVLSVEHRNLLVGDWLRTGDLGFIFAGRGLGKTWFSMNLARGIADKVAVGPWKTHQETQVLYLDGEMAPEDLKFRDGVLGQPTQNITYVNHEILFQRTGKFMNLANPDFQAGTLHYCLEKGFKVLFLDNLSTLSFGVDENKAIDWEVILPWLLALRRNHITVVFIHHAGRNNEMRGSSKREDPAFWVIRLDAPIEEGDRRGASFISRFTKWRNSAERPEAYQWHFIPAGEQDICVEFKECSAMYLFLQWIDSGLDTCSDIAMEMDVTKGYISRLAKKAESLGKIEIIKRRYRVLNRDATQ
jgi:hypothetical protein